MSDLARIIQETETSLAARPDQYSTRLEHFVGADERVLVEFLRQERDQKPHTAQYAAWEGLVGKPELYKHPIRYRADQKSQFLKLQLKFQKRLQETITEQTITEKEFTWVIAGIAYKSSHGRLREPLISQATISAFSDVVTTYFKMMDMEARLWESVVAYAKQIGAEQGRKPVDVVRNPEARDEIYRRIFPTQEQFAWYHGTALTNGIDCMNVVYKILDELKPVIEQLRTIPLVGWLAGMQLDSKLKKIPPEKVTKNFLRDGLAYDAARSGRLYRTPEPPRVIDVTVT